MTDIVERLRAVEATICQEAAIAIEGLRDGLAAVLARQAEIEDDLDDATRAIDRAKAKATA